MTTTPAPLDPACYRDLVRRAVAEDVGAGDLTTTLTVRPGQRGRGEVRAKQACVVAGLAVAIDVFRQLESQIEVHTEWTDGDACEVGDRLVAIEGPASSLLTAERTALNFLQRLCGIATETRRYVTVAAGRTTILDTRKTTPTFRCLEKYAVRMGGAVNHRQGLDDGVLIKDNHVRLAGSIHEAVTRARAGNPDHPIEVEAQSPAEVDEALGAGADAILIDNFPLPALDAAITACRGRATTEVSGGVTLDTLDAIARLRPTYVSVGALTHSASAVDLSFEMVPVA